MDIQLLKGPQLEPCIDELAQLRISVFREFPYLYDGDLAYEAEYLSTYLRSPDSVCVLVRDQGRVVGASTGLPLADETEQFQRPFVAAGWNTGQIFYCAESVVLPGWRGRGLGVRFFQEREAHARRLGRFEWCAFCAVQRPQDHPRRPAGYQPLDAFWTRRGYRHHPELHTEYHWRDLDETEESGKPMSFWLKELV
ncbi:GNAT family N-acetyltransferase [Pseudomonas sp. LJDD11]|uniref:GNAT family N-acetyltransferase n=1 Tax=Pseudomonas sp. LJDD11 TaxID=2931984 RepID=UPI00211BDBAA|nr:GNAT family N-acetyltransferase [Pseudomonas sp. LJDD11]MCQ9425472.1 GNAT family N-acetyltransferase [Pseudomonas sp. LJDD11]